MYRFIRDAEAGWRISGNGAILESTAAFVTLLEDFNLPVTMRVSTELTTYVKELAKKGGDHRLTNVEASELKRIMMGLEKTLIAESGGRATGSYSLSFYIAGSRSWKSRI